MAASIIHRGKCGEKISASSASGVHTSACGRKLVGITPTLGRLSPKRSTRYMVFSKVGPNQSIEWGQIRISKSPRREAASTRTRTFSTQPRTVCARQSIDGEVVARAAPAIADGEPGFRGRGPPATERTDQPAEEMSERHDHGKHFSGKDRIKPCAKSFIRRCTTFWRGTRAAICEKELQRAWQ